MSQTIEIPNNVPVSWLQRVTDLSNNDLLMLASEPNSDTETQYMSRYFTYYDLYNNLSARFRMGDIWNLLSDLYENKISLSDYLENTLCCDFQDPYIISSITQGVLDDGDGLSVGILSIDGYRLSSGMKTVFNNAIRSTGHLSTVIPSLVGKWTTISNSDNYITSILDGDGHVQSFGEASLTGKIAANATDVKVCNGPAGDTSFKHQNPLRIQVLQYSELQTLRNNGQIQKNTIYMTVDDPDDVE